LMIEQSFGEKVSFYLLFMEKVHKEDFVYCDPLNIQMDR
jgi:hypothetical protein